MKRIVLVVALTACGQSATNNELIGQVKKVIAKTPIICPDYFVADVSLGVMRNGVGSMSHEDVELYVAKDADVATLKSAAETGHLVRVAYDTQRIAICRPAHWLTRVVVVTDAEVKQ